MKNLVFKNYYYSALVLSSISMLAIFFLQDFFAPSVPLLYGSATGEGQLVPALGLLIAPGASLIITVLNIGLSMTTKDDFSKKALAISALVVSILTTITIIKIVFLIGFF